MAEFTDYIARNALWMLSLVAFVWLLLTALFWHVVHAYGDNLWRMAVDNWNALRASSLMQRLKGVPILGTFFARTLTGVRYLGLYAVFAFAIAIGAVTAFFALADEIGFDEDLAQFDSELAHALDRHLSYAVLRFFSTITHIGDPDFLTALVIVVAVFLAIKQRWLICVAWLAATTAGGLFNLMLKRLFERPRPVHDHGLAYETSFSFPSGHASGSMLVYSLLGYLIVRHTPRAWHIPIAVATVALIVFVGSSRVLLQVHYFSDVLAGYASAAAWSALCIAGLETVRWRAKLG